MFEELVLDLYEEVDRRETEAIWATSNLNTDSPGVPFLPTNPHLSATRNQVFYFSFKTFYGLITIFLGFENRVGKNWHVLVKQNFVDF